MPRSDHSDTHEIDQQLDALRQRIAELEHACTISETENTRLRMEAQSLQLLLTQLPAIIWTTDADLRFTSVQGSGLTLLGIQAHSIVGTMLFDMFPTAGADFTPLAAHREALHGVSMSYEHVVRGHTYQVHVEPLRNTEDMIIGVIAIAIDISQRKQAEVALQASEERFRLVTLATRDVIYDWNVQTDAVWRNEASQQLLGSTEEMESTISGWQERLHPADREMVLASLERAVQTGAQTWTCEYRFRRDDSSYAYVDDRCSIIYDASSKPVRLIGAMNDITERKHAEARQAAQLSVSRILSGAETIESAIPRVLQMVCWLLDWQVGEMWQIDPVADALRCRSLWCEPELLDTEFVQHNPLAIFGHGDGLPGYVWLNEQPAWIEDLATLSEMPDMALAWQSGIHSAFAFPIQTGLDSDRVLCFFSREPRPYDQALAESMIDFGIQIDQFVKRKRTEAALIAERTLLAQRVARRTSELSMANADLARAIRTRDEFLATMSHELRTPLNAVIGFTEALQEQIYGPLNEKQLETLRVVGTSSHHLLDLINDILDLSRIEASSLDLRFDLVNIEALCHASLRLIKPEAVRKQIQVTAHIECSEKTIQADERRLKQILVNLLSNAVKFTPPGGAIGLEVTTCETENQVCFCVWDTGIGIAPEDLGRLFKPFEQLDGGLNKRHEGTGMGLALVSRLTDMHNGSVSVQSQTGQGSRFTVSLPCQRPDSDQDAGQSGGALPVLQCVLIIAEAATAAAVTPLFQQWNAHVHIHTCGAGALDRVLEVQPDIILLAPALSDISGWQVALRFKVEPRARDIPLIMLAEPGEHVPGLPLGLAASLVKPVSQQELAQVIEIVLQRKPHIHSAMLALSTAVPEAPLILLAEDNEIAISMVVDYLQQQGYRVDVARNGAEALEHAREELPALILMDIQMPGMDGLQAIRHIRDDARLSHLPIIALTALAMPGDRETCLQAGANEYLSKPVNLKHLVTVIESQLASARETRA